MLASVYYILVELVKHVQQQKKKASWLTPLIVIAAMRSSCRRHDSRRVSALYTSVTVALKEQII